MGETNSPLVAHVGYDISLLSTVEFKILIKLSWVEKYRNPRATEGESICNFVQTFGLSHLKRVLSCLTPPPFIDVSVYSVSIAESEWLYVPVC
jgi:hypothetical protein